MKTHHLIRAVPVADIALVVLIVAVDKDGSPGADIFLVEIKAFAGDRAEGAVGLIAVTDPLRWLTAVVLCVVKVLKRQPVFLALNWS